MDTSAPEAQRKDEIKEKNIRRNIERKAERKISEEAELKRIDERPRLSGSGKVCIFYLCSSGGVFNHNIYILDLASQEFHHDVDDHGFVRRPPTLRLYYNSFRSHAFCVLGSTLFVFEASRDLINPKGKSAFSFDLSLIDDSKVFDFRLEKTSLSGLREMNYPKRYPAAVPTPDGKKILVFSTLLNYNGENEERGFEIDHPVADEIDFELYDPVNDSWEILPGIPHRCKDVFDVGTYAFINKSTFLLQTQIGGFTLDLGSPDKLVWKSDDSFFFSDGPFSVINDELVLTPFGALDMKRKNPLSRFFQFPVSSKADIESCPPNKEVIQYTSSVITLLDDVENGEWIHFCVAQTGVKKATSSPRMFVDVCSINLVKYREDKEKEGDGAELKARNVRALKFILDDQPCGRLYARNVFSMPGGT